MIRIRPGRSWRLNPGYVEKLLALSGPHARRFDAGAILDVVGIEVDGVDIAAGVGEAQVLLAVAELAEALVRLGDGAPAAQATVGPGPTDAVLEARGADVQLGLLRLTRPSKVLAQGLLVDGARLRAAALAAARGLLADLLDISPALRDAPVSKRLAKAAQKLSRRASAQSKPWPPTGAASASVRSLVLRGGRGAVRCEVQIPLEAAERLAAPVEGAPLASLLGRGAIALRVPGAPAIAFEAPLYLALRDAVHDAEALVHAWESGDRSFELQLGATAVHFDLTRDELRAPGWTRPAQATPPQIALALAGAARTFAARGGKLAPEEGPRLEPLDDLREAADALLRHCRDLESGELRRAPEAVSAPPVRKPQREHRPLQTAGRVRRLVFRQAFAARLHGEPSALLVCGREAGLPLRASAPPGQGGALAAVLPHEALGLDLDAGARLWSHPCAGPRALARAQGGSDLFVLGPEALLRLDGATGQVRWRRRMQGGPGPAAAVFGLPGGALVCAKGALALVGDSGTVAWRARIEEAPEAALAHESALLLSLPGGMIAALDATTGRALFRRRVGARAGPPLLCAGRLVVVAEPSPGAAPRLIGLDPHSGQPAWEIALPEPLHSLPALLALGELVAVACKPGLRCVRASDGARRWTAPLPWPGPSALSSLDELDEPSRAPSRRWRGAALVASGPGGALALFDSTGARAWLIEPRGAAAPLPAQLARGLALAPAEGEGLRVVDAVEGLPVAHLGGPRAPTLFATAPDLTVALANGPDLSVHRLATHLSLV